MKKIRLLLMVGVLLLLVCMAHPVAASRYAFGERELVVLAKSTGGQLNAAISKYEGLLNAYSRNQNQETEEQVLAAIGDLSSSVDEFNAALLEVYPNLSEEEQQTFREAYSSFGSYLGDLAYRTNSAFGREVIRIEREIGPEPFNAGRVWVGSFSST